MHKKGDKLYIPSAYHCSRGSDDVEGGLATLERIETSTHLPKDHYNYAFAYFKEHPGRGINYKYVLENQDEWANEYAGKIAHPNPGIDRPFIEKGDIVNGKPWTGSDIW
jgi:hypothetical protein